MFSFLSNLLIYFSKQSGHNPWEKSTLILQDFTQNFFAKAITEEMVFERGPSGATAPCQPF
jgi:hypothetical protein